MAKKTGKPMVREGQELKVLDKGDRRRLSDGRNAWRKMVPDQRREFLAWIMEEEGNVPSGFDLRKD
jgi:hypothetical protein